MNFTAKHANGILVFIGMLFLAIGGIGVMSLIAFIYLKIWGIM